MKVKVAYRSIHQVSGYSSEKVCIDILNMTPHYTALSALCVVTSRSGSFTVKLQILCGTCTLLLMTLAALVSSAVGLYPE